MVDVKTIRRIAGSLPETEDLSTASALRFEVRGKGFAWSWHERVEPKRPRRPRLDVLAVRCPPEEKEAILSSDPEKFFTESHYRGFPAVLVRLDKIAEKELRALLTVAWRCRAPRALVKETMAKQPFAFRETN
jgi:hypothetical protein